MNRRISQLAVLATVCLALAALVVWTEQPDPGERLTALTPAAIDNIVVQRRDGRIEVAIVRSDDRWRLTVPFATPANPLRARRLAALAGRPAVRSYARAEVSLQALSLDPPLARLALNDQLLEFGGTEPVDGLRYVAVGARVHLVEDDIFRRLLDAPERYVDPSLLGPQPRVAALRVADTTLTRTDSGWQWLPTAVALSADDVSALVSAWESAAAISVEPLELGAPWAERIEVDLDGGEQLVFVAATLADHVLFARRDVGVQFRLPKRRGQRLLQLRLPAAGDD